MLSCLVLLLKTALVSAKAIERVGAPIVARQFPSVTSVVSLKTWEKIKLQTFTTPKLSSGETKVGAATSGVDDWGFPRELIFHIT